MVLWVLVAAAWTDTSCVVGKDVQRVLLDEVIIFVAYYKIASRKCIIDPFSSIHTKGEKVHSATSPTVTFFSSKDCRVWPFLHTLAEAPRATTSFAYLSTCPFPPPVSPSLLNTSD